MNARYKYSILEAIQILHKHIRVYGLSHSVPSHESYSAALVHPEINEVVDWLRERVSDHEWQPSKHTSCIATDSAIRNLALVCLLDYDLCESPH